jgi:hypothetical protein
LTDGGSLVVKIEGDEIVARPGTDFVIAYKRATVEARLMVSRTWVEFATETPTINQLFREAFQAAVHTARELGVD